MKKILLAVAAVATFASCSQNEEFENVGQKAEIKINSVVKSSTRAAVTSNDNFNKFKIYSYITEGAYVGSTALGGAYMEGVEYTKAGDTWGTTDTNKYYWPSGTSKQTLQFFAFPNDLITDYALPADDAAGYPSFTYTIEDLAANQKDLVVAHEQNMTITSEGVTDGAMTLKFNHILSRINFAFIPEDLTATYTIDTIKIADVKGGTAKYTFNASTGAWDITSATSKVYGYKVTQSNTPVADKSYFMLGDADASLMLFPQSVANKVITVTYSTVDSKGMEVFSGDKTVTLPAGSEWNIGQNIVYVLTLPIGAEEITIKPEVSIWPDTTGDDPAQKAE